MHLHHYCGETALITLKQHLLLLHINVTEQEWSLIYSSCNWKLYPLTNIDNTYYPNLKSWNTSFLESISLVSFSDWWSPPLWLHLSPFLLPPPRIWAHPLCSLCSLPLSQWFSKRDPWPAATAVSPENLLDMQITPAPPLLKYTLQTEQKWHEIETSII